MDFLSKIIAPQLEFEGGRGDEKFQKIFCDLYRIEIFKDGLDLILTKMQEKQLRFEVKIIKGWDTNVGCFLTEKKTFFDQTLGKIFHKNSPKIILRSLSHNVMAHEMAHALEFESGVNLGEEFRKCIALDMNGREPQIVTLKAEVRRLMVEALKAYPPHQFLSELFARYFELLSISRNVQASGSFATSDVTEFFANTTNFVTKIFNPKIRSKISLMIAQQTAQIAAQVRLEEPKQKFQERVESKEKSAWSSRTKSNAMWQKSWEKTKEIEEKK